MIFMLHVLVIIISLHFAECDNWGEIIWRRSWKAMGMDESQEQSGSTVRIPSSPSENIQNKTQENEKTSLLQGIEFNKWILCTNINQIFADQHTWNIHSIYSFSFNQSVSSLSYKHIHSLSSISIIFQIVYLQMNPTSRFPKRLQKSIQFRRFQRNQTLPLKKRMTNLKRNQKLSVQYRLWVLESMCSRQCTEKIKYTNFIWLALASIKRNIGIHTLSICNAIKHPLILAFIFLFLFSFTVPVCQLLRHYPHLHGNILCMC